MNFKILLLCLILLNCCNLNSQVTKANIGKKVDNYFTSAQNYGFSGTVLVAKNGKILLNKGFGFADRSNNIKNTYQSVFSTGSITKQFTATAILKLEMMGKLNTNDKISMYFKNVPMDKQSITIHNLLTHTSGLPGALGDDFEKISKNDYLKKAFDSSLLFNPGEKFHYSNVGYSLLAMIVEQQSGMDYNAFLQEYLFKPSGMYHTGYKAFQGNKSVHIYDDSKDNGSVQMFENPSWHLKGNGGILSTTGDMFKWVQSLKSNIVLSKKETAKLFTPFLNDYAYGWDALDGGNLRQHDGGSTLGLSSELRWFVKEDLVTMLFSNATINGQLGFEVVRNDLEALTFGDSIPMPSKVNKVEIDDNLYVGQYQMPSGQKFRIKHKGDNLYLMIDNQELLDFLLDSKNYKSGGINATLNHKYEKAFKKVITANDYSGFEFIGQIEKVEKTIKTEMQREGITQPHFKVIMTTPSSTFSGAYQTLIAVNQKKDFTGESMMLHIVTKNEKFLGMGVDFGFVTPLELNLVPVGNNKFQAYSLLYKFGSVMKIKKIGKKQFSLQIESQILNVEKI